VKPESKPGLESLLEKLKERTEEAVSNIRQMEPVNGSGRLARHYYYCPECLTVEVFFRSQFYYMRRRGKKPQCPTCRVEMKPIDEYFKAEYEKAVWTFYEKVKRVLERSWFILDSWRLKGVSGYFADTGMVEVYFDYPSSLALHCDGRGVKARLYIHYLDDEEQLGKLLGLISILREEGIKGEVRVDGRSDHCKVPEEKMRAQGFVQMRELRRLPLDNWHLKL
jgi:hypothetical protein